METLPTETKLFVRHDPLPSVCDSSCPALDLGSHTCKIFKSVRRSRQHCVDPRYTIESVNSMLGNTDIESVKLPVDTSN